MRISIATFFDGNQSGPLSDYVAGVARSLEERGIGGVWLSEHVVSFDRYDPAYPYPYTEDGVPPEFLSKVGILDPMIALGALAMHSSSLRLATGVVVLPQRNPVYFAKEGAAVDRLSNGRFVAGLGLGWSAQEFAAAGASFEKRGARMRDYIQVVRSLWQDEVSRFEGQFYSLAECIMLPKPVQQPHPPFFFGGESTAALRRIAEFGQGWYTVQSPAGLQAHLSSLTEILAEHGRSLDEIAIAVAPEPGCPIDEAMIAAYAALGVSEIVLPCFGNSLDEFRSAADVIARDAVRPASMS
jgi:probable F420-dependent oxidoreductase